MELGLESDKKVDICHLRPWSFSKVQKAKRCAYDFYWTYVEKQKPAERADFFVLGSGVHFILENAIETVFKRCRPLNYGLLSYFFEKFKEFEPDIPYEKVKPFFPNILNYVNSQIRKIDRIKFFHSEVDLCVDMDLQPVEFNAKTAFIRGKLDFIFAIEDTLYIVDHKTNRSREFTNRVKTQLRWYALLAGAKFPEFKKLVLEIHNVRYGTVQRFVFTERDIMNFQVKLLPVIEMTEGEFFGKTFSELIPSPSSSNCRWCDFRHICPTKKRRKG